MAQGTPKGITAVSTCHSSVPEAFSPADMAKYFCFLMACSLILYMQKKLQYTMSQACLVDPNKL